MRYLGGKTRLGPKIAPYIVAASAGRPVWDAFCGGLGAAYALARAGLTVHCSDKHPGLIAMYTLAAEHPIPEDLGITRDCHEWAKGLDDSDPFKAFVRFGCSYGGNWSSGFAKNAAGRDFSAEAARSVNAQVSAIVSVGGSFFCLDFLESDPTPDVAVYLDPPYAGTTRYAFDVDTDAFWKHAARWAETTDVFVSEYAAPVEWELIAEWPFLVGGRANGAVHSRATERLFYRGPESA